MEEKPKTKRVTQETSILRPEDIEKINEIAKPKEKEKKGFFAKLFKKKKENKE